LSKNMNWVPAAFPQLQGITNLAQGGQKFVFAATHPSDGDVVLKIIQPTQPSETVRREILAVNTVQSPRVPRILEAGLVPTPMGQCIWIREQRILGVSLRERLRQGPLSAAEILKLTHNVLEALEQAEKVKIVHRDVKPDNIMVDGNGDYWLLDFGIARHLSMTPLTATASPWGKFTPGYAPVEQFRNFQKDINSQADLFALGITIYECATGKNPFVDGAANALEVLRRVENTALAPLSLPIKASDSFKDLLSSMTQKKRAHRPASIADALTWIQDIIKAETI
jgi:eukaryotic-like serine/threonine-protein kinase